MKKSINYVFRFEERFYDDVERVINNMKANDSEKNNMWLIAAYIYNRSNAEKTKPCQFMNISRKSLRKCVNMQENSVISDFIQELKNNDIIIINKRWKAQQFAKQYAVSINYKESLLNPLREMKSKIVKLTKGSFRAWGLISSEELIKYVNEQNVIFTQKDKEQNIYKEYEKNSIGYHEGKTETEKILHERMEKNFSFNNELIIDHINKSSNIYDEVEKLIRFVKATKNKTYSFSHGRSYLNGYSNGAKVYRDTFLYDDKKLIELMDVKSCFVLLTVILASLSNQVEKEEIKKLYKLIVDNDIYVILGAYINKDDYLRYGKEYRDVAKSSVIRWYFMNNQGKKSCGMNKDMNKVKQFFKNNFPTYYSFLTNYAEIKVPTGKIYRTKKKQEQKQQYEIKSCLAIDCQWLENKLIVNTLMKKYQDYKVITLHDSLWISEDQYSEDLVNDVKKEWNNIICKYIFTEKEKEEYDVKQDVEEYYKEANKENIIQWLKANGTKQDLIDVEDERYYDLYKIAYEYKFGMIKSTRDM